LPLQPRVHRTASTAFPHPGLVLCLAVLANSAWANEPENDAAPFPIPKSILSFQDADEAAADGGVIEAGGGALIFEPDLTKAAIRVAASHERSLARSSIPLNVIRNGFSTRVGAPDERAVGFKVGADIFSVTTRVVAAPGSEQGRDARIDWRLAKPVVDSQTGFIWAVSTEGGSGIAARPTQSADLLVGYRHQIADHVTVTSQVVMGGGYVFAPDGAAHSELVPEVKMTADLGAIASLPWSAALDVTLARKIPLTASAFETRGSAMLRLKYSLE